MTTEYEQNDNAGQINSNDVHAYFSQINPIAERIAKAITDTKDTYGMLWYKLNNQDQSEILNETLIKPELTLHYIDSSLAFKRSQSSSSLDNVINECHDSMHQLSIADVRLPKHKDDAKELRKLFSTTNQQYYGFDGRSLNSFAQQRVAQKLLKDDTLADAGFRDEHSAPFSYRTRSQINFHLDNNDNNYDNSNKDKEFSLLINTAKAINEMNTPSKIRNATAMTTTTTTTTKNQSNSGKKPKRLAPIKPTQLNKNINTLEENKKPDIIAVNYAINNHSIYSPDQHDNEEESSSLIPHETLPQDDNVLLCNLQLQTNNNNNNTTFTDEDDEHEYYNNGNHDQMEEVKLLDSHVSLKRGFEFLNNW